MKALRAVAVAAGVFVACVLATAAVGVLLLQWFSGFISFFVPLNLALASVVGAALLPTVLVLRAIRRRPSRTGADGAA